MWFSDANINMIQTITTGTGNHIDEITQNLIGLRAESRQAYMSRC